ncbi:MAG: DUF5615 family PIN-like protein [bacterium]|nr:DUF5615 family PIN-like protein [bacterium]
MKFKIDENLPVETADLLRQLGHDAATVLEQNMGGEKDSAISTICQQEKRSLITLDLNFSDIRTYPPNQFSGIIVLRLKRQDKPYVLDTISRLIPRLSTESLESHLWIVEDDQIRIRR